MPFRNALVSSLAMLLMFAPSAGFAHHGWSSYDSTTPLSVTAPLSSVSWGNPHGSAKVMWQKKEWTLILAPVSRMEARGLTKAMLTSGKPVTLIGYPRSDGTAEMRIERVTVDRKTVELR